MARLDEQFLFAAVEPQQKTMRRLVAILENRLAALEAVRIDYEAAINALNTVALARINDVLLPASERIIKFASMGFLIAHSQSLNSLIEGQQALFIINEDERDVFIPTPFVVLQRQDSMEDYAIALVDALDRATGSLLVSITSAYGAAGPFDDWVISASPGVSEATRYYFEQAMIAKAATTADAAQAAADRAYVASARAALEQGGLDPNSYAWRDGSRPFTAVIKGVTPITSSNDTSLPTTAWTRQLMANAMSVKGGQTITGGFSVEPADLGIRSTFTITPGLGNYQYVTRDDLMIIHAPETDCAVDLLITNAAGAGAVTLSGFDVAAYAGDPLLDTLGYRFLLSVRRINGISTYNIKALQ